MLRLYSRFPLSDGSRTYGTSSRAVKHSSPGDLVHAHISQNSCWAGDERERAQQRPRRAVERQVEHRALVRRQLRAARRQEEADLGDVARPLDRRGALRRVDHLEVNQDRSAGNDEAEPVDAEGAHCRLFCTAAECQLATAEPGAEWEIVVAAAMALMRIRLFLGHPIGCRQVYKNTLPWWPRFSLLLLFSLCRMRRRWYKL